MKGKAALLNERQVRFAEGIIQGMSQIDAYYHAGYEGKDRFIAQRTASGMARSAPIQQYLQQRRDELRTRTSVTVEKQVKELARIGYSDIAEIISWDEHGVQFIPSAFLAKDQTAAVKSVKSRRRVVTDKDGNKTETTELEVKMHDKLGGLEKLNKILGVYQADRINDQDKDSALLKTVFGRYILSLHVHEGLSMAEAIDRAERDPEAVEAWGKKVKLLKPGTSSSSEAHVTASESD